MFWVAPFIGSRIRPFDKPSQPVQPKPPRPVLSASRVVDFSILLIAPLRHCLDYDQVDKSKLILPMTELTQFQLKQAFHVKWLAFGFPCLAALCVSLAFGAHAQSVTSSSADFAAFFKCALSSPPDVEMYSVSQRDIANNTVSYYVGARASSNYFLSILTSSNALSDLRQRQLITGRSGSGGYELSQNAVSFGFGTNGLTSEVEMLFGLTRQFLDMGVGEIRPESVRWKEDAFTATDSHGHPMQGRLETSNGLPTRLEVSNTKGPYKVIEYVYPNPPTSYGGFPAKMTISGVSKHTFEPDVEVLFYSVKLARHPLAESYFSVAQFVGSNILHTNIYKNGELYVQNRRGDMVKAPGSVTKSGGHANSHSRIIVVVCFVVIIAIPVGLLIFFRKKSG